MFTLNQETSWHRTLMAMLACVFLTVSLVACAAGQKSQEQDTGASSKQETTQEESAEEETSEKETEEKDSETEKKDEEEPAEEQEEKDELTPEEAARIEALTAEIKKAADASGMTCCVSAIDLKEGLSASYQGDTKLQSASMIKMLIAYTFLGQVKEGTYSLDDLYTLQPQDLVGGTGTLIGLGAGAQVSYRDILTRMIDVSDNTGTNILIDACGMDKINETAKELGLKATELNRHMMDYDAIAQGLDNYTCADDMALLMQKVYDGTFVDEASSEVVMTALRQQQDWGGIRNGLPADVTFAHKTGTHDRVRHDGGIVEGDHPFVLVVLCGGDGYWEQGALNAMAEVARVVYADMAA